jgi:hypothetical protein
MALRFEPGRPMTRPEHRQGFAPMRAMSGQLHAPVPMQAKATNPL